ncbi:MAG TPA: GNAT family protein [Reyranella sp.]|nr:GNAT family protein [Reyranella sp.]
MSELPFPRAVTGAKVEKLPSAMVPARSTIAGRYVQLEPLSADRHAADLYRASHGGEEGLGIWTYLPVGPWPSLEAYTAALRQQTSDFERVFYALRPSEGGPVAGQASYLDIHPQNGVIEIGSIWFGRSLRRTRAATEALYLLIRYAMDDLGYRRMQWRCNAENAASRNAARRLGFRYEGIFYRHMIYKGKNRDTAWYSILDEEWPELRAIFEEWLQPANFDADGVAKVSLSELMAQRKPL